MFILTLGFRCRLRDSRPCQGMQENKQMPSASHGAQLLTSKYDVIRLRRHVSRYGVMARLLVFGVQASTVAFKQLCLLYTQVSRLSETNRSSSTASNQSTTSSRSNVSSNSLPTKHSLAMDHVEPVHLSPAKTVYALMLLILLAILLMAWLVVPLACSLITFVAHWAPHSGAAFETLIASFVWTAASFAKLLPASASFSVSLLSAASSWLCFVFVAAVTSVVTGAQLLTAQMFTKTAESIMAVACCFKLTDDLWFVAESLQNMVLTAISRISQAVQLCCCNLIWTLSTILTATGTALKGSGALWVLGLLFAIACLMVIIASFVVCFLLHLDIGFCVFQTHSIYFSNWGILNQ